MKKYRNKKTEINGIVFDSQMESKYYLYLQEQKQAGNVTDFSLQPTYDLIPNFQKGKRKIRKIVYKADFLVFFPNKKAEIIDIKTYATMTREFRLKWKLFDYVYPDLDLQLITWDGANWVDLATTKKGTRPKKGVKHGTNKVRKVSVPRKR